MRKTIISILLAGVSILNYAQTQSGVYQSVVAADGSGNYKTIQEAVDAAPEKQTKPWLIFVKNGSYEEQVVIPKEKPYIHLIGQDKNKTIIHLSLNVGGKPTGKESEAVLPYWEVSVHNPSSPVYKREGSVVMIKAPHFYTENISYINDWGVLAENGPQALAMKSFADCASFNNCIFRSWQDTWQTSPNDAHRHYVKNCRIEGAIDYFYGGGDVLVENSTFYNTRSGAILTAPCQKDAKWGYVFKNCIVDGNEAAANVKRWGVKFGRPWRNSPKAVFINTTLNIPINPEGWTDMGTIPALFAEYNTSDAKGNPIDLSQRKTEYQYKDRSTGEQVKGTSRTTISKEEADKYTYENIISATDGWNPRKMMQQMDAPRDLAYQEGKFSWNAVKGAAGYIIYDGENIVGFTTTDTSFPVSKINYTLKVCAVNPYGALGKIEVLRK